LYSDYVAKPERIGTIAFATGPDESDQEGFEQLWATDPDWKSVGTWDGEWTSLSIPADTIALAVVGRDVSVRRLFVADTHGVLWANEPPSVQLREAELSIEVVDMASSSGGDELSVWALGRKGELCERRVQPPSTIWSCAQTRLEANTLAILSRTDGTALFTLVGESGLWLVEHGDASLASTPLELGEPGATYRTALFHRTLTGLTYLLAVTADGQFRGTISADEGRSWSPWAAYLGPQLPKARKLLSYHGGLLAVSEGRLFDATERLPAPDVEPDAGILIGVADAGSPNPSVQGAVIPRFSDWRAAYD
jgi:hypothetical protein